jgi:UDP-glucose 4-epimerase
MIKDFSAAHPEISAVSLRYFNPIGAHLSGLIGEEPKGIPNNLMPYIQKVSAGQLPHLNVLGSDYPTVDGSGVRDYIHVVDLAAGHNICLEKKEQLKGYHVYNLGTGRGTSVLELVKAFEKANGVEIKTVIQPRRAGDAATNTACVDKVFRELGWKTQLTIEDACRDSGNWVKKNPNGYSL